MSDGVQTSIVLLGAAEFIRGIKEAQLTKVKFMRSELKRGGQRVRREFIRRDLSGRPGIHGGKFRVGKKVFSFVKGASENELAVNVGISKSLRVHEEGFTFRPKTGEFIYIKKDRTGRNDGTIVAKVRQVVIPKRTNFVPLTKQMAPEVLRKAGEAGMRGVQVAVEKSSKRFMAGL
ncbi:MAG: hypothetical protein H8K09_13080 [Nitrospira sp.]|nr:hypothetical protein [Nitrospira sp.]